MHGYALMIKGSMALQQQRKLQWPSKPATTVGTMKLSNGVKDSLQYVDNRLNMDML